MSGDWTVIWFLTIIGFVAGNKVKLYGLDVNYQAIQPGQPNLVINAKTTSEGKPNFHTGDFVLNPVAKTVEAIVTANNSKLFQLNGTFEKHTDRLMVEGFVNSKFLTGSVKLDIRKQNGLIYKIHYFLTSAEGTLEVHLDKINPLLKLTPKNGTPMELSGKHKTSNDQWLIELLGNSGNTKLDGNIAYDIHDLKKIKGTVKIAEGQSKKLDFNINTVDLPHSLEIFPASKAGIPTKSSTGMSSDIFFLEGDYKLWKKIHINSNLKNFSSFRIDTMQSNMLRVELNQKELFQQTSALEYLKTKNFKSVKASLMLPLGIEGGYIFNIATDNLRKNQVNLELKLEDTNMISVNWDTSNLSNMKLNAELIQDIEQT